MPALKYLRSLIPALRMSSYSEIISTTKIGIAILFWVAFLICSAAVSIVRYEIYKKGVKYLDLFS